MKQAKLGIVFVVAIMALAAAGAGYALWSQTLTIEGTINTGEFVIGVRDDGTGDPGPYWTSDGNGGELYPDGPFPGTTRTFDNPEGQGTWDWNYEEDNANNDEGKNIAQTESLNNGNIVCVHEDINYYDSIEEKVYNAYPYYMSYIAITFANDGTVPGKIHDGRWNIISDPFGLMPFLKVYEIYLVENLHEEGNEEWYDLTSIGLDGFQYQLDPCDTVTFVIMFYFDEYIPNPAGDGDGDGDGDSDLLMPELATATFTYDITWAQWNEESTATDISSLISSEPSWFNYVAPQITPP